MIRQVALTFLLTTLGFAPQPGMATETSRTQAPGEDGYFEELPIVLTPSRMPIPLDEAPASVTVLDGALIRATGYRDIARLLRLVPGMQIGQDRSGHQGVTYHGLNTGVPIDIQVLIDGRAIYSPTLFTGVDWHGLPITINEIERIEVVRGTNPVAFGPNAFLGVVNIITRHAGDNDKHQVSLAVGDSGIRDASISWNRQGEDYATRLTASSRRDNGFVDRHDSSQVDTLGLRSDHRLTTRDEVMLRISGSQVARGRGVVDSPLRADPARTADSASAAFHAQWRRVPAENEEMLLSFVSTENWRRDHWLTVGPRPDLGPSAFTQVPVSRNYRSIRQSLEFQHHHPAAIGGRWVWGGEIRQEKSNAPFMFNKGQAIDFSMWRLFGNLELPVGPALRLNLGSMLEDYSDDQSHLSPRIFANWKLTPTSTLRAGYSRAWREHNTYMQYADVPIIDPVDGRLLAYPYLPNPTLRRPRIDTLEIGYFGRFGTGGTGGTGPGNTSLDVRLFQERIADFVISPNRPELAGNPLYPLPSTRFENLPEPIVLQGLEYQVRSRLSPQTQLLLSHSMIKRRVSDPIASTMVAPYQASLSWLQDWGGGWSSMASLLRLGPMACGYGLGDGNPLQTKAYTTLDFRIARRGQWQAHHYELALAGINLGPSHQEVDITPTPVTTPVSRMLFLSLTITGRR